MCLYFTFQYVLHLVMQMMARISLFYYFYLVSIFFSFVQSLSTIITFKQHFHKLVFKYFFYIQIHLFIFSYKMVAEYLKSPKCFFSSRKRFHNGFFIHLSIIFIKTNISASELWPTKQSKFPYCLLVKHF